MMLSVLGCYGPYPAPGEACSGYLLEQDGRCLLLDCGSGVLGKLFSNTSIERLDGVVLTHLHWDHCSDALALMYAVQFALKDGVIKSPIPLMLPAEPANISELFANSPYFAPMIFDPARDRYIGQWKISCLPVRHSTPAYAVRVSHRGAPDKALVYTGDTNIHQPLLKFASGADVLVADAAYRQADWTEDAPHMSAECAAGLAANAGVRRLILTHYRPGTDTRALAAEAGAIFKRSVYASPGLKIQLAQ